MITAREIANKKFEKASFGGYRGDDVDGFLNEVAAELEALEEQNNTLNKKLEVLAEKLEEYRNDEESLRTALLGAQKLGDSVIRESKNKAEIILRDATIKADRMVSTAHDQVEREKMIYVKLQKDVAAFKNKLLATYRQHLEIISSLPDETPEDKAAHAAEAEAAEAAEMPDTVAAPAANTATAAEPARAARTEAAHAAHGSPEPEEAEELFEVQFEDDVVVVSKHEDTPDPQDNLQEEPARQGHANDYEEATPPRQSQKFIPVPPRHSENAQSGKFDEYYEDFDDEDSKLDVPSDQSKKSKFGTLKFGAGYDLKRE